MLIFPAIDLHQGRVVRWRQGDPAHETVYGDDPVAMARHWVDHGAPWLHVVNLDGALGDQAADSPNRRQLQAIVAATEVPVQFGGGLRSLEDVARVLDAGVRRVILGTVAIQDPAVVAQCLSRFGPERIVLGLDARGGIVATHGWQESSGLPVLEVARRWRAMGVLRAVYTEIERDGMLGGLDAAAAAELARGSGLGIIASGGVRDADDIRRLRREATNGIEGVIVGQALYAGTLDLGEAVAIAGGDALP